MKPKALFFGILLSILFVFSIYAQQDDFPVLKGSYLGQKPPGMTPELFAPGFVSTDAYRECSCTFTPDGKEFYFGRRGNTGKFKIMVTKMKEKGWSKPVPMSFSSEFHDMNPHVTHDGIRMYFDSFRPLPGHTKRNAQGGIWFVERIGEDWGEVQYFGQGMCVSISKKGTMFYEDRSSKESILKRYLENGEYAAPEAVRGGLYKYMVAHPAIAPDESYLIIDAFNPEGQGKGRYPDHYVCFHKEGDYWSEPINLGDSINGELVNNCVAVSHDGKYLFYTYDGDIYWVSAKIIEDLKPKELK